MERTFSKSDALQTLEWHDNTLNALDDINNLSKKYRNLISYISTNLLTDKAYQILANTPIDELNRDRQGFRISALRANGYKTIKDVLKADVYSIADIFGISDKSACLIKDKANDIYIETIDSIKLQINPNDRSQEMSVLITTLLKHIQIQPVVSENQKILAANKQKIRISQKDIQSVISNLKWTLSSKKKKVQATEAFKYLSELINGEYGKEAKLLITATETINRYRDVEAWKDFSENTFKYFNDLEDICPGIWYDNNKTFSNLVKSSKKNNTQIHKNKQIIYVNAINDNDSAESNTASEYEKLLNMSYSDIVNYLLDKYGVAKHDYFKSEDCKTKNPLVTRTDEGLICHHIDEDKAIMLCNDKFAAKNPFDYQKADRLVYCNLLEHFLLHIKIAENPNINANEKELPGI